MILSGWLLVESELKFAMGCRLLNDHLEKGPSGPFLLSMCKILDVSLTYLSSVV